jgi:hypothetical protein
MSAEHERLKRKHQSLKSQDDRMHEREGIDRVQSGSPDRPSVARGDLVMVARIGIGDAAAAWSYPIEASFEERLERHDERARPSDLLRVEQLLAALTKT